MKTKCKYCGLEQDAPIFKLEDGSWVARCIRCNKQFPVEVPEGNIIMAFTDPADDDPKNPYKYFTDEFEGKNIWNYWVFDTPEEFIKKWKEDLGKPRGMWYWVLHEGKCICSGACDPGDIEQFEEYFKLKN